MPKCASTSTNGCGVRVGTLCTFTLDCTSLQFYITAVSCDIAWQLQKINSESCCSHQNYLIISPSLFEKCPALYFPITPCRSCPLIATLIYEAWYKWYSRISTGWCISTIQKTCDVLLFISVACLINCGAGRCFVCSDLSALNDKFGILHLKPCF